tara:strand:+ start:1186 stop:1671 length:486 start_codon:yes stop_codon:yes gene_type:complete
MSSSPEGRYRMAHLMYLLRTAAEAPPWTFVNLLWFAVAPTAMMKRASYCSVVSTAVSFEVANLLDGTVHRRLWEKQNISCGAFYTFNVLVHWVPALLLHVSSRSSLAEEVEAKAFGFACHVGWGLAVTKGTMDLSSVYVEMEMWQWWVLWGVTFATTMAVP